MEYKTCKLKDIATVIMGQSPKGSSYNDKGNGKAFLQGNRTFGRLYPVIDTWTTEPNKIAKENSILMSVRAPVGDLNIANQEICIGRGLCSIEMNNGNNKYLFYLLKYSIDEIKRKSSGTVFDSINRTELENIDIIDFDVEIQNKITSILFNIDKKIELNNQINDNLQKLILSLFNEFLDDNKDYNETTIKDAVKKIGTGADAIQRAPIVEYDTGIRCIRVGDMTNSRTKYQWGFTEMTEKDFENYKLSIGDIIVTRTAVNGLSYLIEDDMKVVCNNGLIKMSVNSKYNPLYIYLYLQTKDFYDYVHRIDGETSVRPNMKVEFFTSYKIMEIPIDKQNEICNQLSPLRKMQQSIIIENERLANLRDTLLPKLMNGEINLDKIEI